MISPANGGEPVAGLALDQFVVTVGGAAVPDSQIISSAYIQGEYWLLLRAPAQAAAGSYDLTVEYDDTLSDTNEDAVVYSMLIESDNLIVADRSGSMDDFDKLEAAQAAARLYVDSWETGDQIGLISYSDTPVTDLTLRPWTTDSRDDALEEIEDWIADGGTGIGAALIAGLAEFDARGDDSHPWAIVLLSDGQETVDEPNIQDFLDAYEERLAADPPLLSPTVHAIALGADADQATMQTIAQETGGTYHFAGEPGGLQPAGGTGVLPNELAEIYRVVGETVAREQQVMAVHGTLLRRATRIHSVKVDGSASEAIFAVNWVPNGLEPTFIQLKRPDGSLDTTPDLVDDRHVLWRVPVPMPGTWEIQLLHVEPGAALDGLPDARGRQRRVSGGGCPAEHADDGSVPGAGARGASGRQADADADQPVGQRGAAQCQRAGAPDLAERRHADQDHVGRWGAWGWGGGRRLLRHHLLQHDDAGQLRCRGHRHRERPAGGCLRAPPARLLLHGTGRGR